ncbi:MAG TPA: Bor protein [Paludibacteraceae bacterium]|nr:Bor protein [Paludibacteraceae bacterium]HPL94272.1 Bor protein [Paludibacteraceae bacterium]
MKKFILKAALICGVCLVMTSCYTYTYTVGNGPQTGVEVTKKNHYLIAGLVPISTSNPTEMAGGAANYEVTIQHTFVDGLLNGLTGGLYSPTTTKVRK